MYCVVNCSDVTTITVKCENVYNKFVSDCPVFRTI